MTFSSLLILAITAAASPFSLVAFSLVLATDRGARNGIAFICGWITTVMLIGVAMSLLGSSLPTTTSSSSTPGTWTLALELALGVVLALVWLRRRLRPPQPATEDKPEKPVPGWQRRIATMGYPGAFVTGGLTQTWPVMIAAMTEIVRADLGTTQSLLVAFAFTLATTAGIVILEVLALRSPGSAAARLDRLRNYIDNHRNSVINWAYLLAGAWLFFRGLIGLIS
jgi:threonine/homoserine/homoserine lactone efflux protein